VVPKKAIANTTLAFDYQMKEEVESEEEDEQVEVEEVRKFF
jgi:hypothetical protein